MFVFSFSLTHHVGPFTVAIASDHPWAGDRLTKKVADAAATLYELLLVWNEDYIKGKDRSVQQSQIMSHFPSLWMYQGYSS